VEGGNDYKGTQGKFFGMYGAALCLDCYGGGMTICIVQDL
jgi:hypothetical protein